MGARWVLLMCVAVVLVTVAVVTALFGPEGASGGGVVTLAIPAVFIAFQAGQTRQRESSPVLRNARHKPLP